MTTPSDSAPRQRLPYEVIEHMRDQASGMRDAAHMSQSRKAEAYNNTAAILEHYADALDKAIAYELGDAAQPAADCIWPDCGHDGNGVGQSCCRAIKQTDSVDSDVPFATVQRVVKALTWLGRAAPSSQEMQAAQAVELVGWLCDEVLMTNPSEQPAAAGHGVIHATIRATDEDDVLHVECRFDDGQKYAAIEVSGHRAEELADTILSALTEVPAAAGELPEAVAWIFRAGPLARWQAAATESFAVAGADSYLRDGMADAEWHAVYTADQLRAAVAGYRRDAELAKDAGHDGAIRYVLGYLNGTGDNGGTMYDEILCACGRERIIRSAIEDGELEFTGLGTYIKNYGTKKEKAMLRAALANLGSGDGKEGP